jgi:hypothetical protein
VVGGTLTTALVDGRQVVEAGFINSPHAMVVVSTTPGTTIPAGNYLYRSIYTWNDSAGQLHRSSPSPVLVVNQPSAVGSQSMYVPLPALSYKVAYNLNGVNNTSNLNIELYRTDAAGTQFYLVASQAITTTQLQLPFFPIFSAMTNFYAVVTDGKAPTTASNFGVAFPAYWQFHYESSPPPAFIWQCNSQGRQFGLACVDGSFRVYFTNVSSPGIGPEWNVTGYVQVPPELGDCRSIAALDQYIAVFGTRGIGAMSGSGPGTTPGSNGIDLDIGAGFTLILPFLTRQALLVLGVLSRSLKVSCIKAVKVL